MGAEYIFLEKMNGVPLSEKWDSASDVDRYEIIQRIVEIERELAGLHFPAKGSLYFRHSLPLGTSRCLLDSTLDPSESFCVGPSCSSCGGNPDTRILRKERLKADLVGQHSTLLKLTLILLNLKLITTSIKGLH